MLLRPRVGGQLTEQWGIREHFSETKGFIGCLCSWSTSKSLSACDARMGKERYSRTFRVPHLLKPLAQCRTVLELETLLVCDDRVVISPCAVQRSALSGITFRPVRVD